MTSVYLILAHGYFSQLERLVRRLSRTGSPVVIHIDQRTPLPDPFPAATLPNVFLTKERHGTAWGSFEVVVATLTLLREAIARFPNAKYFSLLSGQDYPIKSLRQIDAFFEGNDSDFIGHIPLAEEQWRYGGKRRIDRFYWAANRKSLPGFVFRTIPLPPRRFPIPLEKMFTGSQWWSLRGETVKRLLAFVDDNPDVLKAFRWTYIADEMFFQTVLAGLMREKQLVNNNLRHIEYFSLPRDYLRLKILNRNGIRVLTMADLEKLKASPALFARKFDAAVDSGILDSLDELCEDGAGV